MKTKIDGEKVWGDLGKNERKRSEKERKSKCSTHFPAEVSEIYWASITPYILLNYKFYLCMNVEGIPQQ